jgi:hypothetical protein
MGQTNITQERAARRFHHLAALERQLRAQTAELVGLQDEVKHAKKACDALVDRMRQAARDEGELPLFDMDDEA